MLPHPATDLAIQKWVERQHGFVPHPEWIAHCKQLCGLLVENVRAYRQSRFDQCPPEKRAAIKQAFRQFGMLL